MTKIDKIIKIDNSANTKPVSFVPRGQNFTFTVGAGDALEFKTNDSSAALYYSVQEIPGAVVGTQSSFDPEPTPGGLVAFQIGDNANKIQFAIDKADTEILALLQSYAPSLEVGGQNVALLNIDMGGSEFAVVAVGRHQDYGWFIDLASGMRIWEENNGGWQTTQAFDPTTGIADISQFGDLLVTSFPHGNGELYGKVGSEPGPEPGGLTAFSVGQTVTGFVIDPNARPTGYDDTTLYPTIKDAMDACYDDILSSGVENFANLSHMRFGGFNDDLGHQILVFEGDSYIGYTKESFSLEDVVCPAGWFTVRDDEETGIAFDSITEVTTVTFDSFVTVDEVYGWSAINGTVIGAVEGEPAGGLTPFSVGQTLTGIVVDPTAVPTGYASMADFVNTFSEDGIFVDVHVEGSEGNVQGQIVYGEPFIQVFLGDASLVFATVPLEEGVETNVWLYIDENSNISTLTEKTTLPFVLDGTSEVPTSTVTVIDPTFAPLNGTVLGAVEAEPSTGLTPFSVGQTITGYDFGDVQNGDTSAEMDAWLAGLTYQQDDPQAENPENNGICYLVLGENEAGGIVALHFEGVYAVGIVEGAEDSVIVYSDKNDTDFGPAGWKNLSSGKYLLQSDLAVSTINDTTPPTWNGVLIGAVTSGGGSSLTPFVVGDSALKIQFNTSLSVAEVEAIVGSYGDERIEFMTVRDDDGKPYSEYLSALDMGGVRMLCPRGGDPVWVSAQISGIGPGWLPDVGGLDENGVWTNSTAGWNGEITVLNTTVQGWNGTLCGKVADNYVSPQDDNNGGGGK